MSRVSPRRANGWSAINSLVRDESGLISRDVHIYLRDCYDHAVQLIDVLAFLLSANTIPAGTKALVADKEALAAITYNSQRPK